MLRPSTHTSCLSVVSCGYMPQQSHVQQPSDKYSRHQYQYSLQHKPSTPSWNIHMAFTTAAYMSLSRIRYIRIVSLRITGAYLDAIDLCGALAVRSGRRFGGT
eukprot:41917-Eustigmatos_ZCMA.PRE.1